MSRNEQVLCSTTEETDDERSCHSEEADDAFDDLSVEDADYDDDDDEWEDVDEESVSDIDDQNSELAAHVASSVADNHSSTVANCPDILTGTQLIDLLRTLCHLANRHAVTHTVGLVCMRACVCVCVYSVEYV